MWLWWEAGAGQRRGATGQGQGQGQGRSDRAPERRENLQRVGTRSREGKRDGSARCGKMRGHDLCLKTAPAVISAVNVPGKNLLYHGNVHKLQGSEKSADAA